MRMWTDLNQIFANPQILFVTKVTILVAEALFILYAYLVLRQVTLMDKTFNTVYGKLFKVFAFILFLGMLVLFLLSLVSL